MTKATTDIDPALRNIVLKPFDRMENTPPEPAEPHEFARLLPEMDDKTYRELVEDIRVNGVLEPVVFHQGKILDGRHRYLAARELLIDYPRVEYRGDDPLGFVISLNLTRRHLGESQRASIAAKIAKLPKGANQHRGSANLPTQKQAAEMLNVSERSVRSAKAVQRDGVPELVEAVEKGKVKVSTAVDIATRPDSEQAEIVAMSEKEILAKAKEIRARKSEQKRAERMETHAKIAEGNKTLPVGERQYSAVYVDAPWPFETYGEGGKGRSAENHYPTMTLDEIAALPVPGLAAPDCALFMWVVNPMLPQALEIIKKWGFEFKTVAFVWIKQNRDGSPFTGLGHWTRANAELCLLATKGNPMRLNADVHQVVMAERMEHSRKPDEVKERIERLVPGPYLEMFARGKPRPGWHAWGNQAEENAE